MIYKKWLNGLLGAFFNGGITLLSSAALGVHPQKAFFIAAINGGVGAWLYLAQHPTPWDGQTDRRNGNGGSDHAVQEKT